MVGREGLINREKMQQLNKKTAKINLKPPTDEAIFVETNRTDRDHCS